jgi:hypothetical protein
MVQAGVACTADSYTATDGRAGSDVVIKRLTNTAIKITVRFV